MKNNIKLYHVLRLFDNEHIEIKNLKEYFTPIYLAGEIHSLVNSGVISVDWRAKKITKLEEMNVESLFKKKEVLRTFKREKPSSMIDKKIEVNEPYIKE